MKISQRLDGWLNVLTGLGRKSRDKSRNTRFQTGELLDDQTLSDIYTFDGMGAKIVKAVADDMTKEWVTVENDDDKKILKALKELKTQSVFNQALKWSRCFGGSLIVIGFENGGDLKNPIGSGNNKISWLKEVPRSNVYIGDSIVNTDIKRPDYGQIEEYSIRMGIKLQTVRVHRSRVLEFKGTALPPDSTVSDIEKRYWGVSILQSVYEQLRALGSSIQSIETILNEFVVGKYTLAGLQDIMAEEGGEDKLIKRMEVINIMKSIHNAVLLDETEEYKRDSVTVTGLPELLDRFMMFLSCVTEIPVTRLFGRSPAGQNATGESDLENYYDKIHSEQTNILDAPLQRIVNMVAASLGMQQGADQVEYPITFNPLYQMSDKEKAEKDKIESETYANYVNLGVLGPEEVREKKFPELEEV